MTSKKDISFLLSFIRLNHRVPECLHMIEKSEPFILEV